MHSVKFSLKIILPILVFVIFSCKKDHGVLGVDVQPAEDNLNAENITGLSVTAHTLPYDSIASFNDRYKFIGSNNDPDFGRTDYGLYFNVNMTLANIDFGVNSRISSAEIVLALDAEAYAGDKLAKLTYSVYPIETALSPSEIYYTSDARHHNAGSAPISIYTTTYSIADNGQAILRIKLDSAYAETLLHDTPNLVSNDVFQAKYKGYYIKASLQGNEEGVIYKANLEDDLSGFYLHYKTGTAVTDTIINFKFTFTGSTAAKFNTVKFSPKQVIKDQFQDSTLGASSLYLKGMGMTKLKIHIPFIQNHSDSFKIAVNRAELVLNTVPYTGISRYYTPPKLVLLSIDSISRETYAQDLLTTTDYVRYDGVYDSTNKRYVFNIAREAQLIFSGKKKNRGFYLVAANADLSLSNVYMPGSEILLPLRRDVYYERVIFYGSNNTQLKPTFNLNYVRFKND